MVVDEEWGDTPSGEEEAYALYNIRSKREPMKVACLDSK